MKQEKLLAAIESAEHFEVQPSVGLDEDQVAKRQKAGLVNKKKKQVTKTYPRIFFENVFNELNVTLFVVFAVMLYAGLPFVRYTFMVILIANILIGLIQDIHARILVEKLRVISDPKAKVVRNGVICEVLLNQIVLSDILILSQGDQIPADCILREGFCSANESLLTGESAAIKKHVGDRLLSGSYLIAGSCRAEVVAIGRASYAESLEGQASAYKRPQSEIQHSIWVIMTFCCVFAISMGVLMTLFFCVPKWMAGESVVPLFFPMADEGRAFVDSLAGSMVAMLPAGMFLLTSLTLAVGVIYLAKKNMLVQQLYCIEMLARVDVICFDKTGTLTDGTMAVVETVPLHHRQPSEIDLAISAILHFTKDNNATAEALRAKYGDSASGSLAYAKPFDSETKYSAVSIEDVGTYFLGAYGFVPSAKEKGLEEMIDSYSKQGMRCLLLTSSSTVIHEEKPCKRIENLAILVLSDHLKEDAIEIVKLFQDEGVAIKIISGDNALTVAEIAKRTGVKGAEKCISLEGKTDEEIAALASEYNVFGRVLPEQKAILVAALQKNGHKVAMTGDGVNDILALKIADCSIAMASGSSATRSVAHLVSLDSDFSKLPSVVAQGRRVINNLQRTCSLFLSKTLFAFLVSLVFLVNQMTGGRPYPFTTSNLFVWETFTIGIAAFFLALQPTQERLKGSFVRNIAMRAMPAGLAEAFAALVPMLLYKVFPGSYSYATDPTVLFEIARTLSTMCFTVVSLFALYRVCKPFDKYRLAVFLGVLVVSVGCFVGDFFLRGKWLNITYEGLSWSFPITAVILILLCGGIYFLLDHFIVKFLLRKQKEENE